MAGAIFCAATTAETLLASSSEKCMIKIISTTNSAVKIKEWGIFFDGISVTQEPVKIQLAVITTDMANWLNAAHTPVRRAGPAISARAVVQTASCSSSYNSSGYYASIEVHPQSGYQEKFSYGDEIVISNGGAIGLMVNSPTTVNCMAMMVFEE